MITRKNLLRPCFSIAIVAFFSSLIWSCDGDHGECVTAPEASGIQIELQFEQFEDTIAGFTSKKALADFLTRQPVIREFMLRRSEYPADSAFINEMYRKFTSPGIDTLLMETKKVFGDAGQLKSEFTQAFTNIKAYYPDFTPPKVQTVITGLDADLFVSDTLIVVSLDFFLGEGAKYRPQLYDYILKQYNKENIVPSTLLLYGISNRFNSTNPEDKTVLADMIAFGKAFYFAKHMLPCVADSTFIWYSKEEIEGARKNQDLIWARLIKDEVLFSTSRIMKQKYMETRPKTIEVGEKCPGRIAQWVGWQIINKYAAEHADTKLPEIMKLSNARDVLQQSRYKPK